MNLSFMSFSCPELGLSDMLALARRYGYDGIEPRVSAGHKHGVEFDSTEMRRNRCKQKAEESGIRICCLATSCVYADPAKSDAMLSDTHKAIDLAGDMGVPVIRVFGGQLGEGLSREKAIDLVVASMNAVAPHAEDRGVTVAVETHDAWCDPAHLAEVMRRVDHASIGVNWDIMHPVRVAEVTIEYSFRALQPWIRHVHFHDGIAKADGGLELCPIGKGVIDHRRAVELLKADGYDGFLSGEWIGWEPYDQHLPREAAVMEAFDLEAH